MCQDDGAICLRGDGELNAQAFGVFNLAVDEQRRTAEPLFFHSAKAREHFLAGQDAMIRRRFIKRQHVIGDHAQPDQPCRTLILCVERHEQRNGTHKVGRQFEEALSLLERFTHQGKILVLEVSQTTVNESSRPRRNTAAQVVLFNHGHTQAAGGGVPSYAKAIYPSPDHNEIKWHHGKWRRLYFFVRHEVLAVFRRKLA